MSAELANGLDRAPPATPVPGAAAAEGYLRCDFCRRGRDQVIRLIVRGHAAICSECLGEALAILRADIAQKPAEIMPELYPAAAKPPANGHAPAHAPPLTGRDGFTGELCGNIDCGSFRMVRTGTCSTCQDCGWNGGCS